MNYRCLIIGLMLGWPCAPASSQDMPLTQVLIEGEGWELLGEGYDFTEGPAVAPDGSVYFSDITWTSGSDMQAGHIWRYVPATGRDTPFPGWKRIDDMQDVLPERDTGKTDASGGELTLFQYIDKLDAGDA